MKSAFNSKEESSSFFMIDGIGKQWLIVKNHIYLFPGELKKRKKEPKEEEPAGKKDKKDGKKGKKDVSMMLSYC